MNRTHTAVIALALAVAAVLGATAAMRTVGLGGNASARPQASSAAIAARTHRLAKIEAALKRSLRSRPPKLPPVHAVHPPAPVAAPVTAAPPRVVYQRPAPIVIVKHRPNGEAEESDDGGDGGGDD